MPKEHTYFLKWEYLFENKAIPGGCVRITTKELQPMEEMVVAAKGWIFKTYKIENPIIYKVNVTSQNLPE